MALGLQAQKADQAVTEKVLSDIKSGQSTVLMNQGQLQGQLQVNCENTAAIMGEVEVMRAMMVRLTLCAHTCLPLPTTDVWLPTDLASTFGLARLPFAVRRRKYDSIRHVQHVPAPCNSARLVAHGSWPHALPALRGLVRTRALLAAQYHQLYSYACHRNIDARVIRKSSLHQPEPARNPARVLVRSLGAHVISGSTLLRRCICKVLDSVS